MDSKQDVAVTVPSKGRVEGMHLPVGGRIAEVGAVYHLYKLVGGVRMDIAGREVALGHVGHIDCHIGEIRAG